MPIFRIMGGHRNSNSSINGSVSDTNDQQQQQQTEDRSHENSRFLYPGQRASITQTFPSTGNITIPQQQSAALPPSMLPVEPPRTNVPAAPFVIRGSHITAPLPMTSNNNNNSTIISTNAVSNTTMLDPSGVAEGNIINNGNSIMPFDSNNQIMNSNSGDMMQYVNTEANRPGAYQVSRISTGSAQVYRVTVPPGVRPGAEFTVHAGRRRVRVRCPPSSKAGQTLQITLPPEPIIHYVPLKMAVLTAANGAEATGGQVIMSPEVLQVNQQAQAVGGTPNSHVITIPPHVQPGTQFTVNVMGQRFNVTCPPTAGPNRKLRIVPPHVPEPQASQTNQVFEVAVPPNVQPGQPFALVANGQRVLVTCPPNVLPGQKIRFQLPVAQVVGNIQLQYESQSGWRRTIRAQDLKFQWVRLTNTATGSDKNISSKPEIDLEGMQDFDFFRAAYVRKLTLLEGNDARMRTGTLELVPAQEAVVDSRMVFNNRLLISYADIAATQNQPLDAKIDWFHDNICSQLTAPWEDGHVKIVVRRKHLLLDSVDAIMSLGRDDFRKRWRMEFLGEPGLDAGGVAREWFQLVTEQVMDPDFGLWIMSNNNQMCLNINPSSALSCPDDHLVYFRFLGRVLGRALFDRQLVKGHMVRSLYKHLLGWPITFDDIHQQDEEYYQSLKKLAKMQDVSQMCLDFTATEECMGVRTEVELVPGGAMKEVTNENVAEYLEANLRYRMLGRVRPQLTELLLGFYDVVPEPALTVFDANELELILCGLPEIDLDDWQHNTIYSGKYEERGRGSRVVEWFWETVRDDFDTEMQARLLQFVTGTSGVPSRGFAVLQGIDGNIKKFTIHGVDPQVYPYPRAHTCFNRIDLPEYTSKQELAQKLKVAITMSGVGFDME